MTMSLAVLQGDWARIKATLFTIYFSNAQITDILFFDKIKKKIYAPFKVQGKNNYY
jgi:hypothetical protein